MLIDNLEQNTTETNTEITTDSGILEGQQQQETVLEKTDGGEASWLNTYKEKLGEEWNDKYENLIKKFTKEDQLDTVELLKAHRNLEKSFSEKRQAPEKYEVSYAEDLAEYKIDENDELYSEFLTKAKDMNLLNDQVNGILNLLAGHVKKSTELLQQDEAAKAEELKSKTEELKKSIPDFSRRANEIKNFLSSKLDQEEYTAFAASITTEAHIKAVEKLMKLNRDPVIPTHNNNSFVAGSNTVADQISELRQKIAEASRAGDRQREKSLDQQLAVLYEKLYN